MLFCTQTTQIKLTAMLLVLVREVDLQFFYVGGVRYKIKVVIESMWGGGGGVGGEQ